MERHNFKRFFGQNFLKGSRFVKLLINPLRLAEDDNVLGIGPGGGAVTDELLKTPAKVVSVEIDIDLIKKLSERYKDFERFSLVNEDILEVDLNVLFKKHFKPGSNIKVIGSLPYNISKNIIKLFLDYSNNDSSEFKISVMCFIVQYDVAKAYTAAPPKSTLLSMRTRLFCDIKKLESIPRGQFVPTPKVDGGIILLKPQRSTDFNVTEVEKLMRIGFSSPRKTLFNNLKHSNKYAAIETAFEIAGIDKNTRASNLELFDWKILRLNLEVI